MEVSEEEASKQSTEVAAKNRFGQPQSFINFSKQKRFLFLSCKKKHFSKVLSYISCVLPSPSRKDYQQSEAKGTQRNLTLL